MKFIELSRWKSAAKAGLASLLVLMAVGAEPTSMPWKFSPKLYVAALAGIVPDEDQLIKDACDDTHDGNYRRYAMEAAIRNEWNGPCYWRDFVFWLQQNHLDKRLSLETAIWDTGSSFKHTPRVMSPYSLSLQGVKVGPTVVVFLVDENTRFKELDSIMQNPAKVPPESGPIVYAMKPVYWMGDIDPEEK